MATVWGKARQSASSIVGLRLLFDLQMPLRGILSKEAPNHCVSSWFQMMCHMVPPHMSALPISKCLPGAELCTARLSEKEKGW